MSVVKPLTDVEIEEVRAVVRDKRYFILADYKNVMRTLAGFIATIDELQKALKEVHKKRWEWFETAEEAARVCFKAENRLELIAQALHNKPSTAARRIQDILDGKADEENLE